MLFLELVLFLREFFDDLIVVRIPIIEAIVDGIVFLLHDRHVSNEVILHVCSGFRVIVRAALRALIELFLRVGVLLCEFWTVQQYACDLRAILDVIRIVSKTDFKAAMVQLEHSRHQINLILHLSLHLFRRLKRSLRHRFCVSLIVKNLFDEL